MKVTPYDRVNGMPPPSRWYGLAFRDYNRDFELWYPIPFNLGVRLWLWLVHRMTLPKPMAAEKHAKELRAVGYAEGVIHGKIQGHSDGWRDLHGKLSSLARDGDPIIGLERMFFALNTAGEGNWLEGEALDAAIKEWKRRNG